MLSQNMDIFMEYFEKFSSTRKQKQKSVSNDSILLTGFLWLWTIPMVGIIQRTRTLNCFSGACYNRIERISKFSLMWMWAVLCYHMSIAHTDTADTVCLFQAHWIHSAAWKIWANTKYFNWILCDLCATAGHFNLHKASVRFCSLVT